VLVLLDDRVSDLDVVETGVAGVGADLDAVDAEPFDVNVVDVDAVVLGAVSRVETDAVLRVGEEPAFGPERLRERAVADEADAFEVDPADVVA
jgi:hypothetical protein